MNRILLALMASLAIVFTAGCGDAGRMEVNAKITPPAQLVAPDVVLEIVYLDELAPEEGCPPNCDGKQCGQDGCGGQCGQCPLGIPCVDGACLVCEPQCDGKECGPDGCGNECGQCPPNLFCHPQGFCDIGDKPDCTGKECGPDGVGGSCGVCPCQGCDPVAVECNAMGLCAAPSANDCKEIFDCFDTCPPNDNQCYQQCISSASFEGQMAYQVLMECLQASGYFDCDPTDDECYAETFKPCYDVYYECYHGDLSCVDMYLCSISCPEGPGYDQCSADCYGNGTVAALTTWNEFIFCLDGKGYWDCPPTDYQCYEDAWADCDGLFKECVHGNLECWDIYDCMEKCPPGDENCTWGCYFYGTVDAQYVYEAILDCVTGQCGEWASPECQEQALQGECEGIYSECF